MKLSTEICSVKLQKRTCRILTTINFVLLIVTIGSPLFLWYTFQYGYFLRGVWTVCDHLGCNELLETGASPRRRFHGSYNRLKEMQTTNSGVWTSCKRYSNVGIAFLFGSLATICSLGIFKKAYYVISCINFLLIMINAASPFWLVHPFGEGEFSMGLWTYCFQRKCSQISVTSAPLNVARCLYVIVIISSLTSLIASRALISNFTKRSIHKGLISSIANFITGFCLLGSLVITDVNLTVIMNGDVSQRLLRHWSFYLGCVTCSVCFILGILSALWYCYQVFTEWKLSSQVIPVQETDSSQASHTRLSM